MLRYKLVIFDFDGTLADSFTLFLEAWKVTAERFGFKSVAEDEIERLRGCSAREIISEVGIPRWKLPSIAQYMREFTRARIESVRLFEGVEVILRKLKSEGVKVAIVSSNSQGNVECVLGDENIEFIDHLVCGASVFGKKRKIRSLLKKSSVPAEEVLCVGDEIRDAEVANELSLDFAAVSWGYTNPAQLEQLPRVKMCKSIFDVLSLVVV